jgi:putative effector of murein hydrolase
VDKIQLTRRPDLVQTIYDLKGTEIADVEYCEYIGKIDGLHAIKRAQEIVQAVNVYDQRQDLLEQVQIMLAHLLPSDLALMMHPVTKIRLQALSEEIDEAILAHHIFLED